MGKLVDSIRSLGYHFTEGRDIRSVPAGDGFVPVKELQVRAQDGQTLHIKAEDSPMLFPGGVAFRDGVLDTTLGEGIKTTCAAIYQDYYALDENAMSWLMHNHSLRTREYLQAEKARIGLTDYKEALPEAFFALDQYDVGAGLGQIDVGHYADGRYVAQSQQAQFDDSYVLRMHFTRYPALEDVRDAVTIRKVERDFRLGRHREMFHCGKCGQLKHWLDIGGPLSEKLTMRLSHDCGC